MKIGVNRFLWLCSAACNPCEEALSMFSGQSRNFPELISEQHWERHSTQAAPKSRTRAPGLRNPTECICTLHTPWLRPGSAQDISQHLYKAGFSISQSAFQRAHLAAPRRKQQFLALVHVFCIPWHHALLSLPKSSLYCTDHQNRAPASLWGTGRTSSPKSFPLAKSCSVFHLLCCALSHSHPLLNNSFQIIPKLPLFYSACKDLLFARGCNYSVTSQQNNHFSFYSQWVFNSLTTWKICIS